ncbi:MAG: hypothetical protein JXB47_03210 [Anaerolineae bacterium]|nr:hypothetical protein [Anaerolineae bacterium]
MSGIVYEGAALRAAAMPMGGIGAGCVALCGDGGLRQWQLANTVDHLAHVPLSFFAVWASRAGARAARVLMSDALYDDADFTPSASVNDHMVPEGARRLLARLPGIPAIRFTGAYPIAELEYLDEALPAHVKLEAFSPFVPLNPEASGLPAVLFNFTAHNPDKERPVDVSFLATLQNAVGWDGHSAIDGVYNPGYGGNCNAVASLRDLTALHMTNPTLPAHHPLYGGLALALRHGAPDDAIIGVVPSWTDVDRLWNDFSHDGLLVATPPGEGVQEAEGATSNGAIACKVRVAPGASRTVQFVLAWHFPNRYVNWDQHYLLGFGDQKSLFWLGNAYNNRFKSALAVAEYVRDAGERLSELTRAFRDTFYNSTLPAPLLDAAGSQISTIRTPTCMWLENGEFHGFEGCCGASTPHCTGDKGCCPMDCTHVWNYEMTVAALFPSLERTMRDVDLNIQMHPSGYIPHRTVLPTYLPRAWEMSIGGPDKPALDGMLGEVLKAYREVLRGAGRAWFDSVWPEITQLMDYLMAEFDVSGDGVIRGEQPNTYDISVFGPNTFIGSLYLAALRAAEEMARRQGQDELADKYRERFEAGRQNLDAAVWNGEYWHQDVNLSVHTQYQWGIGCHADQLFGQWWAHALGLGYVLPKEHIRQALKSMMHYNWRDRLEGHVQIPRIFADDADAGLIVCTWPGGGKPEVPTLYSDEIWTGIEYEVAGLLLYEGMIDEALKVIAGVRARYDGTRRSPWNEVECGDHYVRPMSSWLLLEAASGVHYDAIHAALALMPRLNPDDLKCFFVAGDAWGRLVYEQDETRISARLELEYGALRLESLRLAWPENKKLAGAVVRVNGSVTRVNFGSAAGTVVVEPGKPLELKTGDVLEVRLGG